MFNSRLTPIVHNYEAQPKMKRISQTSLLFTCLASVGNSTGFINLVLRSKIGQFLLVGDGCSISVPLYKWTIKIFLT